MPPLSALPILSLVLWAPAVGALVTFWLPPDRGALRRGLALGFTLVALVLALVAASSLGPASELREIRTWIAPLGASYDLGLDGLGLCFLPWIPLLAGLVLLSQGGDGDERTTSLVLFGETALLGMVLAGDGLFYLGSAGAALVAFTLLNRQSGAMKRFFFFQWLGLGVVTGFFVLCFYDLFVQTGFPSAEIARVASLVIYPDDESRWWLLGLLGALPALPLFPFTSWVEPSVEACSARGRLFLLGGFSLFGTLFLARILVPSLPSGAAASATLVSILGLLAVLYAGLWPYRSDPRRFWVPLLVGFQGLAALGLLSASRTGVGAGRLGALHALIGVAALALSSEGKRVDGGEGRPAFRFRVLASSVVFGALVLPAFGPFPTWWVILGERSRGAPVTTALTGLGVALMALRLARGVPVLARSLASENRARRWLLLPLLAIWLLLAVAPERIRAGLVPGEIPPTPAVEEEE